MNKPNYSVGTPEIVTPCVTDFGEIRRDVGNRLFTDPSYRVFDAMNEMTNAAERYLAGIALGYPSNKLWVGGSLGRREMLPNSDIDLFVVYDEDNYVKNDIRVDGVDKFEVGHIDINKLKDLIKYSFVDANRFIDGRKIGSVPANDLEEMIVDVNTYDRQLANNISEYFYYRYFDFPAKTTAMGPNLKYSTGSSRDTIFFNMIGRMTTGLFPAVRGDQPELAEVVQYTEDRYGLRAPLKAIDLLFIAKNAAISLYDRTGDPRSKYVSHAGLESIYNYCKNKFNSLGYQNQREFIAAYSSARKEMEFTVDTLFSKALSEHPANEQFQKIISLPKSQLARHCIQEINDDESEASQSLIALSAWMAMRNQIPGDELHSMSQHMMGKSTDKVWGGLMAVICSPDTHDRTLAGLADWLYTHEKGAYLIKLITRSSASSKQTKSKALEYYEDKEIIL